MYYYAAIILCFMVKGSDNCAGSYFTDDGTAEISAIYDLLKEIFERAQCLERANPLDVQTNELHDCPTGNGAH
jgi:hypothetical protein